MVALSPRSSNLAATDGLRVSLASLLRKRYHIIMTTDTVFFCDVAPIVPIPLGNRQVFSYLSESDIGRGSLVMIPFGPRVVSGIVLSCATVARAERPSGRFKAVRSVVRESFLTDGQLTLAESVSKECLTPFGRTLKHFLPAVVRERAKKDATVPEPKTPLRLTDDEKDTVRTLSESSDGRPFFLESDIAQAVRIVAGAKKALGKKTQALILVPELIAVPFVEGFFVGHFGAHRVATVHGALSAGALFSSWERIRAGEADIVVGTRQALFSPFTRLRLVAVLEEAETVGYKQWDMSPRYDARLVATTLSTLHGAIRFSAGSVAGLDIGFSERLGTVRVLRIGDGEPLPAAPIRMVDMRKERWKKNYSIFSEELRSGIIEARRKNRKVLLIASRSGLDSFSTCVSCKEVPRCPTCDRALRSTRDGAFRCPSCSYKTTSFPRCAKCGSLEFKNVGSGTEKIEREAGRLFGASHIVRLDETSFRKADREQTYVRAASAGILIGTPSVLNIGTLPDVALVAILDADNFLSFPDFRADERFLRMVGRSAVMAGGDGTVIVQAFRPERETIRHIAERSVPELLRKTADDREALRYPPYARIFRIAFRDADESESIRTAKETAERLSKVPDLPVTIRVSPPMKPMVPKVRGRHERIVLVTVPRDEPFPDAFERILLEHPKSWTFDPDPHSLL